MAVGLLGMAVGPVSRAGADVHSARFDLFANSKFLPCLAAPGQTPKAHVTVVKGEPNDLLVLTTSGFKSGLQFDVFTVQRSSQQADGSPVAGFPGFGLAWYQSDLQANRSTVLKTILVNQIFGFDPDANVNLAPTNTSTSGSGSTTRPTPHRTVRFHRDVPVQWRAQRRAVGVHQPSEPGHHARPVVPPPGPIQHRSLQPVIVALPVREDGRPLCLTPVIAGPAVSPVWRSRVSRARLAVGRAIRRPTPIASPVSSQ